MLILIPILTFILKIDNKIISMAGIAVIMLKL